MDSTTRLPARAALIAAACAAPALAQTIFSGLGVPPGGTSSDARAISADGSTIAGEWGGALPVAFRWTQADGFESLGTLPGDDQSRAAAISADGAVIVGTSGFSRAFRWTAAAGMQDLGALPGDTAAIAVALSGDGSMVLGMSYATPAGANPRAFLWTAATGIQPIPSITGAARCMSADGSVIAGHMAVGAAIHAFRWTASTGVQDLGTFPAGGNSYAYAISPDGEAIVGTSDITFPGHNHAFLWRANSGMIDLGVLPFGANSIALGVSAAASGPVIVGYSAFSPFLFSFDTGLVDLGAYLEAQGAGTAGWTINTPYAVSADGRTVVGSGFHNGATEGWIARLGPFCYANCDGSQSAPVLNINDYVCFQGRFAGGDPYANCDQSTQPPVLNINDFLCFQTRFAAGCP